MIPQSQDFDLGMDRERIKDRADADRQHDTVANLLHRMFNQDLSKRWEVQVLADEVGMGKTFVALALIYSILTEIRSGSPAAQLDGCCEKVLVITPQNSSLFKKWCREVSEFVRRCVKEDLREEVGEWFAPVAIERIDDLARELARPGPGPRVLVTHMGVFGGGRLLHYELKRKFLLGALFSHWGIRFKRDARERLLRGAPADWPKDCDELLSLDGCADKIPFDGTADVKAALESVDQAAGPGSLLIQSLHQRCLEASEPYARNREEIFDKIRDDLKSLYPLVVFAKVKLAIPIVVVDEAHNWKNGPSRNANGFQRFVQYVAPLTRRVLLLTATPFQLRPDEMLEILKVGDSISPCLDSELATARRARLSSHREEVIRPVLEHSARQSRSFGKAWARIPLKASTLLEGVWSSHKIVDAKKELSRLALLDGVIETSKMSQLIDGVVAGFDPNLRELLREALRLYAHNTDLSQELGALVIRHRRKTEHRSVRVGAEYVESADKGAGRSDRHVLHASPGLDVRGAGELPHYLLMRCVSASKHGKGRSSLGTALTGCYSTLLESAEGKGIHKTFASTPAGKAYLGLLLTMVGEDRDAEHPKVKAVVDAIVHCWQKGEKILVFCFRTHTARRLRDIAHERISAEMALRRKQVLGGEDSFKAFRARITRRDGDLIVLGLDRVLWSLIWAAQSEEVPLDSLKPAQLRLVPDDLVSLAQLGIRFGVDLTAERVDRVFLHRAHEHIVAKRLLQAGIRSRLLREILQQLADERWVESPYGLTNSNETEDNDEAREESSSFDERGVHSKYEAKVQSPDPQAVQRLTAELTERRERAIRNGQISILDRYVDGPSFWLGPNPTEGLSAESRGETRGPLALMHRYLLALSRCKQTVDWLSRLKVFQAMRRTLLRDSILFRLLPTRQSGDESDSAELVVKSFFSTLPEQTESMADRLTVFLEDLRGASGSIHEPGTQRQTFYEATKLGGQRFVALVDGSTNAESRERVFAGFNTPLLPEVLICTSVGQEGIDLHRHCRHVVHYDLAWNPAVLEQRTGRVDRIGSKTFRERSKDAAASLEVGVPFLAGTYDERMYEELRLRAQTFEVLTGGDVASDNLEGRDDTAEAEGQGTDSEFPPLPSNMLADLRVELHVWAEAVPTNSA